MAKQDKNLEISYKLLLQELKEDPYRKFNFAFSLMVIIPFLVFLYLLANRLFTPDIFAGNVWVILFISFFISLCGFYVGFSILRNIFNKIVSYAVQAKHSDQLKSTFVATVSHELKNPLSSTKTNIYNIFAGFIGEINDEQKKVLELCQSIIERMVHLINDLLDLHKIEAGMVDVKRGVVTLRIYPQDSFARIECIDTGPGIASDKIDRLFNKFERLDITKEGTGLGLAITKDIVEMHKGRIHAESQVGKGTKFTIVLPRDLRKISR